jgi:protein gp37
MGDHSAIEWCDASWNPVTGCSKVSPGCAHCYAERLAPKVFAGQLRPLPVNHASDLPHYRRREFTDVECHEDRLDQPLRWKRPRRIFVNSMSDLFHEDVPDEFLHRVYHTMEAARWHTFQILTKRAARMRDYLAWRYGPDDDAPRGRLPSRHIWHGVSVENQKFVDERIPLLLETLSAVRFISAEPLLDEVDLTPHLEGDTLAAPGAAGFRKGPRLDWVIVGGESGPGARPFDLAWARSIVEQCQDAGVPVFVKQLGAHAFEGEPENDGCGPQYFTKDRKGGDITEWPHDLQVRQFPAVAVPA